MIVGVTGSRIGLTMQQSEKARGLLVMANADELHHGDCVGADEELARFAANLGVRTVAHPPTNIRHRAYHESSRVLPPKDYRRRNIDIVNACDVLWAFPSGEEGDQPRSGTWMTVRIARQSRKPIIIVTPDGVVIHQEQDK